MKTFSLLAVALILVSGCIQRPSTPYTPPLAIRGESYASSESRDARTFKLLAFDDSGKISNDLVAQAYADYVRPILVDKGYREVTTGNELFIFITIARTTPNKVTSTKTVSTMGTVPGSTSQVNSTIYTPSGPIAATQTINTASRTIYGQRQALETTVYQQGSIELIAYDQKQYNQLNDPSAKPRQAWLTQINYSYEFPLTLPAQTFYPGLLRLVSDKIGAQHGEWMKFSNLDELLAQVPNFESASPR